MFSYNSAIIYKSKVKPIAIIMFIILMNIYI